MELRFHFDDGQMARLQEQTRTPRATDLAREGIELLDWATNQVCLGREVVSVDDAGNTHSTIIGALNRARMGGQ